MSFVPEDGILGLVVQIGWLAFIVVSVFYGQRLQMWTMLREVGSSLTRFKVMKDWGRKTAITVVKEVGKKKDDPTVMIEEFLEHRVYPPVDLDPAGIVWKLEHVLDVRDVRFKEDVKLMAPEADETQIFNLEMMLGCAAALNIIYKIIRHYYLLGKKTMSLYSIMQVQMILPMLLIEAKAYASALKAISQGQPIGDGVGALVAAKLMHGYEQREIAKDTIVAKVPIEDRTAYVIKAVGPGANVGKPGEAIKRVLEENEGKISTIIMVDASQKLEGEKRGDVYGGVGVIIGGIGVEKFKADESVLKHKVPVNAVYVREDMGDAISAMRKEIIDSVDPAIEKVKRLILERTNAKDSIMIVGVGNSVGIGQ